MAGRRRPVSLLADDDEDEVQPEAARELRAEAMFGRGFASGWTGREAVHFWAQLKTNKSLSE